jgi:recombination protein RecR
VAYPEPLEALIQAFEQFPGVGRRTAERLAFHALRDPKARGLAPALERAVRETQRCSQCANVAERNPCAICADSRRDRQRLCVVEEPRHVETIERAGAWNGLYHVLLGAFQPAEGTEERHLGLPRLIERVQREGVREVVLATDPDAEGEATAALLLERLEALGRGDLVVSRLARGLPSGSGIEYLHKGILEDAFAHRRELRTHREGRPAQGS